MHNLLAKQFLLIGSFILLLVGVAQLGPRPAPPPLAPPLLAAYTDAPPPPVPPPASFRSRTAAGANFNITWGGDWPQAAKDAFEYAVGIWVSQLRSNVPIEIDAQWQALGSTTLGQAGAVNDYRFTAVAPAGAQTNTWYQYALANALVGVDVDPARKDIQVSINSSLHNSGSWYYGTDGNTPFTQYDLVTVVLHELGHGLGFAGDLNYDNGSGYQECNGTAGIGCYKYSGSPRIYDRFAKNGSGQQLVDTYPNFSSAMGNQLISQNLYFDGPNTRASNGGSPAHLYAPSGWQPGSSYSHLDLGTYAGTVNSLMRPSLTNGTANHNPGPITLGIFQDLGWQLADTNTPPTLSGLPDVTLVANSSRDNAIDLWSYAADAETADADLTFIILDTTAFEAGVSVEGNRFIDITPEAGWSGTAEITVEVRDAANAAATDTFTVQVNPENQPPSVQPIPDQIEPMNTYTPSAVDLWLYVTDEEPDESLTFALEAVSETDAGISIRENRYVAVNPTEGWTGTAAVTIRVTDSAAAAAYLSVSITVQEFHDLFVPLISSAGE